MRRTCLGLACMLVAAAPAAARQEPGVEIGGGAGYARALHGDLGFGAAAIAVTARFQISRHLAMEPEFGYWRHSEEQLFTAGSQSIETKTTWAFVSATGTVLVTSDPGSAVRVYGGGGPGVYYGSRRFRQTVSASSGEVETDHAIASVQLDTTRRMSPSFGAQFVGGADARIARRLRVFGEYRFEIRSLEDPGSSVYRIMGGVRVPIG